MTELDLAVLTFLGNALWQGALIALAAWCAVKLLDSASARGHYWIWVAALVLSLAAPFLSLQKQGEVRTVEWTIGTADRVSASLPPAAAVRSFNWATGIYGVILLFEFSRLLLSWRRARNLRSSGIASMPADWLAAGRAAQQYFGVDRVEFGISKMVSVPLTVGFLRPVILLPENFDSSLIEGTIAHEMAHIARRDYPWNFTLQILAAPLSLLPGAVFIKRHLERAREMACDELAAEAARDNRTYARQLVAAAQLLCSRWRPEAGLGVLDGNILEARVARLTKGGVRATMAGAVAAALAITLLTGATAASYTPLRLLPQAAVSGILTDASGARVPNGQVRLLGPAGETRNIRADAIGQFRFAGLKPGSYSLEVRQPGFRILRSRSFQIDAGTELTLRGSLDLGMIRQTINVIAD